MFTASWRPGGVPSPTLSDMAITLIVGVLVWLSLQAVFNWLDVREHLRLWGIGRLDDDDLDVGSFGWGVDADLEDGLRTRVGRAPKTTVARW
jgi:hypothetical protein